MAPTSAFRASSSVGRQGRAGCRHHSRPSAASSGRRPHGPSRRRIAPGTAGHQRAGAIATRATYGEEGEPQLSLEFTPAECAYLDSTDTELCMLPFPAEEIMLPGMAKTLHLYEARYIALLEAVMERDDNMFVHTVVVSPWEQGTDRPVPTPGAFLGQDFALCYNTLVQVLDVQRQDYGALVSIRGEGWASIGHLTSTYPHISGYVEPMLDEAPADPDLVFEKALQLNTILHTVIDLGERIADEYAGPSEVQEALQWVKADSQIRFCKSDDSAVEKASRLSFAALQHVPMLSDLDQLRVMQARIQAMETVDVMERLDIALDIMSEMQATLAAKASLKSLGL
eukprot:jgi/Tetstr1/455310/TSEL_042145.t1